MIIMLYMRVYTNTMGVIEYEALCTKGSLIITRPRPQDNEGLASLIFSVGIIFLYPHLLMAHITSFISVSVIRLVSSSLCKLLNTLSFCTMELLHTTVIEHQCQAVPYSNQKEHFQFHEEWLPKPPPLSIFPSTYSASSFV